VAKKLEANKQRTVTRIKDNLKTHFVPLAPLWLKELEANKQRTVTRIKDNLKLTLCP
jgi:hypothetical protein